MHRSRIFKEISPHRLEGEDLVVGWRDTGRGEEERLWPVILELLYAEQLHRNRNKRSVHRQNHVPASTLQTPAASGQAQDAFLSFSGSSSLPLSCFLSLSRVFSLLVRCVHQKRCMVNGQTTNASNIGVRAHTPTLPPGPPAFSLELHSARGSTFFTSGMSSS